MTGRRKVGEKGSLFKKSIWHYIEIVYKSYEFSKAGGCICRSLILETKNMHI